jgi:cytochrome b involved in lipid metabolism/ferredoxin-NADP reductase
MSFLLPASLAKHLTGTKTTPQSSLPRVPNTVSRSHSSQGNRSGLVHSTTPTAAARLFSVEEVAAHNTESDCYTVVEGKVYDITKYLRLHPGGFKLLFKNAGGDSTADFLALRHSAKSRIILEGYYVGDIAGSTTHTLTAPGAPLSAQHRTVGALVGPQSLLGGSLPHNAAINASHGGSVTPFVPGSMGPPAYPPPRSNGLHPSTSHPDRLSAYTEQQLNHRTATSTTPVPLVTAASSSAFSINLVPPAPVESPSRVRRDAAQHVDSNRSLTTLALEKHLSEEHITPPLADAMMETDDAPTSFPSFRTKPPVPLFNELPHNTVAAAASASIAASSSVASPALSPPTVTGAPYGPRHFVLKRRVQQDAPDVQLLSFEPIFPLAPPSASGSLSSTLTVAASSSHTPHPSPLDPAFWLRIPPGQHISVGLQIGDEYVKRPYTPIAHGQGCFDLLIRAYPLGVMSRALHSLPIGAHVDIFGPTGLFDFESALRTKREWIMLGAGTGIAPLFQIIKHVRAEATDAGSSDHSQDERFSSPSVPLSTAAASRALHMALLYCNRHEDDILLNAELTGMQRASQGKLIIQHVLSQPQRPILRDDTVAGRLNAEKLKCFLDTLSFACPSNRADDTTAVDANASSNGTSSQSISSSPSPHSRLYLVCGSDEFHSDVTRLLLQTQKVASEDIFCF